MFNKNVVTNIKIHETLMNFKRPSPHSRYSPSAAERWNGACTFSIQWCQGIPEQTSKYAEEGTLAHSVCEATFREEMYGISFPIDLSMKMMALPDKGMEMLKCAQDFALECMYWLSNKEELGEVIWFGQEKGLPIFPEKGCFGTADFIIVGTKASAVIDFKYGVGKVVSAQSPQLKVYASAIARFTTGHPQDYKVYAVIFQPRVRQDSSVHSYTMGELNQELAFIWKNIIESERKDLKPNTGNHCYWCPAKRTHDLNKKCPAIMEEPIKQAHQDFSKLIADMNAPVKDLTTKNVKRDEAMIKLLTIFDNMKDVVENCRDELTYRIESGEAIAGVFLENELGNRELRGKDDEEKAKFIKSKFPNVNPFEVITTKKLRTITDIEKETGKNTLDVICNRKSKKVLKIRDEKTNQILNDLLKVSQNNRQ